MKYKDKSQSRGVFLGVILLLLALLLFLLPNEADKTITADSPKAIEMVNRHLRDTSLEISLKEQKARIAADQMYKDLEKAKKQDPYKFDANQLQINEYQDYHYFNESVGRGSKIHKFPEDPSQLIQTELFNDETDRNMTEAYKEEYARQFIENARLAGWAIKLDSSFRVISVRPLQRRPTQDLTGFESQGSSGR